MLFFDSLCEIGPRNEKDPAAPWSVEHVIKAMDRCGIDGALVLHTLSIDDSAVCARKRLADEIAPYAGRLFPVWGALPLHARDSEPTPQAFLDALAAGGVRAVKLFPETHAYPLRETVMGPVLAALESRRILTMIDLTQLPQNVAVAFEILDDLLTRHPDLPFLLQRHHWGTQRWILPLLERHPNFHIDMSAYQINRGIEEYVARFGPRRMVLGTGLPVGSPGAARAAIDYADVPTEAKELIAGGNLSRLLGGLRPKPAPAMPPDPLRSAAAAGRPITDPVVLDAHCHVLPEGSHGVGYVVMHQGDSHGLVELKDRLGIRRTAIMSWSGPAASDAVGGNVVVAEALAKYPDRFIGMVYVNPAAVSPEFMMEELRNRIERDGFTGLKPYPRAGLPYNDPLYDPAWQYANARGRHVLLHPMPATGQNPEAVDDLAARYPQVQWVVAHVGGQWKLARGVVGVMKKRPNVWAELTYTTVLEGVIEWMASQVGDDRILFGTDAPMRDPRQQFGWVIWADLPVEGRRRILGDNFARLLAMGR